MGLGFRERFTKFYCFALKDVYNLHFLEDFHSCWGYLFKMCEGLGVEKLFRQVKTFRTWLNVITFTFTDTRWHL